MIKYSRNLMAHRKIVIDLKNKIETLARNKEKIPSELYQEYLSQKDYTTSLYHAEKLVAFSKKLKADCKKVLDK